MIWPLVYLAITILGIGVALGEHGKPKKGEHNFWVTLVASLIICWVLYRGGFFNPLL